MEAITQITRYRYIHEMPCGDSETEGEPGTTFFPSILYDTTKDGCNRLQGKVALIEGGDTGLGRAVAVQFAKEGAELAILFNNEGSHARETAGMISEYGKQALLIACDVSREDGCKMAVDRTISRFGKIDILVNNAALENIVPQYHLVNYTIPHLAAGSSIINTSMQEAIIDFTKALSSMLIKKGIRVNAVAPGAIWDESVIRIDEGKSRTDVDTRKRNINSLKNGSSLGKSNPCGNFNSWSNERSLENSHPFANSNSLENESLFDNSNSLNNGNSSGNENTFNYENSFNNEDAYFGKDSLMGYAAHPADIAPCFIFLASEDAAFISGEILHPNGGTVLNS
ncbi:SDR family oxidoreductase [Chitinophaga sancti]|uniref:SDR family oxidoreductase n=1 Tax=Chitinophaga sancti TaxID=1004 RepID=UPI003F794522